MITQLNDMIDNCLYVMYYQAALCLSIVLLSFSQFCADVTVDSTVLFQGWY